jgi:hypothetical protein
MVWEATMSVKLNGTVYILKRYLFVVSSMTLSAISDYRPAEQIAGRAANKKLKNKKCGKKAVVA